MPPSLREGDREAVVGVSLELQRFFNQREDTPPVTCGDSPLKEGAKMSCWRYLKQLAKSEFEEGVALGKRIT